MKADVLSELEYWVVLVYLLNNLGLSSYFVNLVPIGFLKFLMLKFSVFLRLLIGMC